MATVPTTSARSLLEEFLRHLRVERGLSPRTGQTYAFHLNSYVAFLTTARHRTPLNAIRTDILAYVECRQKQGVQPSTQFGAAIAIRQFHRFLTADGHAAADPAASMPLPKIHSRKPEPLTEGETERLFSFPATKFSDIRDRAILELLYSGLRITEALATTEANINMVEGYVRVTGKGGRERVVPVGSRAVESLGRYLEARAARFSGQLPCFFVSYRGKSLTRTAFWLRLKSIARRAGIRKRLYPHLLRHGFATDMLNRGCDLKTLQEMLGHASLATTSIYLHPTTKHLIQAHRRAHPRA